MERLTCHTNPPMSPVESFYLLSIPTPNSTFRQSQTPSASAFLSSLSWSSLFLRLFFLSLAPFPYINFFPVTAFSIRPDPVRMAFYCRHTLSPLQSFYSLQFYPSVSGLLPASESFTGSIQYVTLPCLYSFPAVSSSFFLFLFYSFSFPFLHHRFSSVSASSLLYL